MHRWRIHSNDEFIIDERFKILETFLFDLKTKTLFLADLHIGLEDYYREQGINLPRTQFKEIKKNLINALKLNPIRIVFLGDIKHEFGKISKQEWFETLALIQLVKDYELILIKGNHDTILEPITKRFNIKAYDEYILEDLFLIHGHKEPNFSDQTKKINYILMGHEHPAISLKHHGRVEKFKCFLLGSYHRKKLIVLPSSHTLTEGTDVLKESLLSPLLKDITNFEVIILADKPYYFHRIKDIVELIRNA